MNNNKKNKKNKNKRRVKKTAPAAQGRDYTYDPPKGTISGGCVRSFRHSEQITSVNSSSGANFAVTNRLQLQPADSATFPYLSTIARSYEQYRFKYLRFRYVPSVATTEAGIVYIAPDYNPDDENPSSEAIISAYQDSTSGNLWTEHSITCDPSSMHPMGGRKYTHIGIVPWSLKTFDGGAVFFGVSGANAGEKGMIWVDYDIDFFVPKIEPVSSPLQVDKKALFTRSSDAQTLTTEETDLAVMAITTAANETSGMRWTDNTLLFDKEGNYFYEFIADLYSTTIDLFESTATAVISGVESNNQSKASTTDKYINHKLMGTLHAEPGDYLQFNFRPVSATGVIRTLANSVRMFVEAM